MKKSSNIIKTSVSQIAILAMLNTLAVSAWASKKGEDIPGLQEDGKTHRSSVTLKAEYSVPDKPAKTEIQKGSEREEFGKNLAKAEEGDAEAQYRVGCAYYGRGTTQDDDEAFKWLSQSGAQGKLRSEAKLREMFLSNRGIFRDKKEAYILLKKAEKKEKKTGKKVYPPSQLILTWMYEEGSGT